MSTRDLVSQKAEICRRLIMDAGAMVEAFSVRWPDTGDLVDVGYGDPGSRRAELICAALNFLIDDNGGRLDPFGHPGRLFEIAGENYARRQKSPDKIAGPLDFAGALDAERVGKIPKSCDVEITLPFDQWCITRRALLPGEPGNDDYLCRDSIQSFTINRIKFDTGRPAGMPRAFDPHARTMGSPFRGEDFETRQEREDRGTAPCATVKEEIANAKRFRDSIDSLMHSFDNANIFRSQVKMIVSADCIAKIPKMLSIAIGADAALFQISPAERPKYSYAMYNGLRFDIGKESLDER